MKTYRVIIPGRQLLLTARVAAFLLTGAGITSAHAVSDILDGEDGVTHQIRTQQSASALYDYVPFPGYFHWKAGLAEEHGFAYGFNAYLLPQQSSDSPTGESDALSAVYRFAASWSLARESSHPGKIELRIENRSAFGSSLSATELSGELGISALNSGFIYTDNFDTDFSVLSWSQVFEAHRFGYAIGRLAFDVYQDTYFGQTISGNLLNRAFLVNPAIGTTGIGALGAVAKGFVSDNVWLGGQIYDANARSGEFDMDTFDEGEWLTSLEIGWTPEEGKYKSDRYLFTYWDVDERAETGVAAGHGWTFTASRPVNDRLTPFFRYGYSNGGGGAAARRAASLGIQYYPKHSQSLGVGFGWAEPSDKSLDDEYVVEAGYKVAITPQLSIMPDLQVVFDPANNPDEDRVWVFSLRTIFAF